MSAAVGFVFRPVPGSTPKNPASGFTALAWDFDAPVVPPSVQKIVNAADLTPSVAPGSLISVFGSNLNPTNAATREMPLPTAIGQSCLLVNGAAMPMLFASPGQINAQPPLRMEGREDFFRAGADRGFSIFQKPVSVRHGDFGARNGSFFQGSEQCDGKGFAA